MPKKLLIVLVFGMFGSFAFAAPTPTVPETTDPSPSVASELGELPESTTSTSVEMGALQGKERIGINVKLHPVVLLIGMISLDVDYRLAEKFTVGLVGSYLNREVFGVKFQGSFLGARGTYSFGEAYTSGPYVAGQLEKGKLDVSTPDLVGRQAGVATEPTNLALLFGYQWFGDRFNMNIGAGYLKTDIGNLAIRDLDGKVVQEVSVPFPPVTGELALGVTF